MTGFIGTIGMGITKTAALMAMAYNFIANHLSQPAVEYKVLAPEFVVQVLLFHLIGILDNSTLEVKNIFEPVMQHPGTCFFTTDTTCTIHDNIFILTFFKHTNGHG